MNLKQQLLSEGFHPDRYERVWTRDDGQYIQFATICLYDGEYIISRSQEYSEDGKTSKADLLSWGI